ARADAAMGRRAARTLARLVQRCARDQFQAGAWSRRTGGQRYGTTLARQRTQDDRCTGRNGQALDRGHQREQVAELAAPITVQVGRASSSPDRSARPVNKSALLL